MSYAAPCEQQVWVGRPCGDNSFCVLQGWCCSARCRPGWTLPAVLRPQEVSSSFPALQGGQVQDQAGSALTDPSLLLIASICSSGGGGGGQAAKDALGNDVTTASWLATHQKGDRSLTQGLKVSLERNQRPCRL
jgi:hypothetical protein